MPASFRSGTQTNPSSTGNDVSNPPGVVAGDVLIAMISGNGTIIPALPAGWTQITSRDSSNNGGSQHIFQVTCYRVFGASTPSTHNFGYNAIIVAYKDVLPTPFDGSAVTGSGTALVTVPSVTTTLKDSLLLAIGVCNSPGQAWSTPSGMVARYEVSNDGFPGGTIGGLTGIVYDELRPVAGATGTRSVGKPTNGSSDDVIASGFALSSALLDGSRMMV